MKVLYKSVFALYLLALLWLVLFKFSYDIFGVLFGHQSNALNLIPFAGYTTPGNMRELIDNVVVFIPFGLFLGILCKQTSFMRKLLYILGFSAAVEALQFILAIGQSDITDLLSNTFGGLIGLLLYRWAAKHASDKKLDTLVTVTILIILVALILFRTLVLKVRY